MRERVGRFVRNVGVASGEIYLGYVMMGIFPVGTLAGVLLVDRGVRNFQMTIGF